MFYINYLIRRKSFQKKLLDKENYWLFILIIAIFFGSKKIVVWICVFQFSISFSNFWLKLLSIVIFIRKSRSLTFHFLIFFGLVVFCLKSNQSSQHFQVLGDPCTFQLLLLWIWKFYFSLECGRQSWKMLGNHISSNVVFSFFHFFILLCELSSVFWILDFSGIKSRGRHALLYLSLLYFHFYISAGMLQSER